MRRCIAGRSASDDVPAIAGRSAFRSAEPADATTLFRVGGGPVDAPDDATMPFHMVSQLADATMQFRVVSEPTDATDGQADVNGYLGQAELRALIRSILADAEASRA